MGNDERLQLATKDVRIRGLHKASLMPWARPGIRELDGLYVDCLRARMAVNQVGQLREVARKKAVVVA